MTRDLVDLTPSGYRKGEYIATIGEHVFHVRRAGDDRLEQWVAHARTVDLTPPIFGFRLSDLCCKLESVTSH
jgi:hypothetical protein